VVRGARENNLKTIDVAFPLGRFVAVTGVSGSGKSSLVTQILHPALAQRIWGSREPAGKHARIEGIDLIDKVIEIDQSPIGRTPRSNPATYTGLWSPLRELLAAVPESRLRGYKPGRFSFNVKGGRCEACEGAGIVQIEMHFLPDVYVQCEVCKGKRYNRETLEVHWKGKTISDVLELSVEEALDVFGAIPPIRRHLQTLNDVGLGYVRLGQPAPTLSGGEAQRVKLAAELAKRATGKTLYILDEPTTGLHFEDIRRLLDVLHRLVDQGNTVIVIEHNLDVIKTADHIVDLGPEGGDGGGHVVVAGTPEDVAAADASHTGRYLRELFGPRERGTARRSAAKRKPREAGKRPAAKRKSRSRS
jgi:excinuclease ABC subunit A